MLGGYTGKFLWVNLTTGQITEEIPSEDILKDFIGGYGIGARILFERQKPNVDPLGPDNILGFTTGPLTASPAPTGTRWCVVGKSPLTGGWADANGSGFFGVTMKMAGYDAIFFTGQAEQPVYLFVDNGKAELLDAGALWGKDTYETEDTLWAELGDDVQIACIGPSSEKLSLISGIIHYKGRAAGRSGLGAVMGSKRLKAVAVRGDVEIPMAQPDEVKRLRQKYVKQMRDGYGFANFYMETGTPGYTPMGVENADSPTMNWAVSPVTEYPKRELSSKNVSFDEMVKYRVKKEACWHCPLACWGTVKAEYGGEEFFAHQPEYETGAAFGSMCLIDDMVTLCKVNEICNRYGLDTISAGGTIAFAIECYENGLIAKEDTDGIEMTWGNTEAVVAMTEKLAKREGFGDVLADGVKVAAEKIGKGAEKFAIHVGGQELPMHDPRFEPGLGLIYLIDATPGRHTQGTQFIKHPGLDYDMPEFGQNPKDQEGRGRHLRVVSGLNHVMNATGMCLFGYLSADITFIPEFLTAITGQTYTLDDLFVIGDRIANLRHAFNLREGVNPLDWSIPDRAYGRPPLPDGPTEGVSVEIEKLLADYLQVMDWDLESTKPSRTKLEELGLSFVADAL